ncbi:MAG: rod shape-determining protein MreC [Candidatus Omnitrophica bacterium]|nr:rod shape-determining protein MreC [Candidatus Omnitrophota bacterium]
MREVRPSLILSLLVAIALAVHPPVRAAFATVLTLPLTGIKFVARLLVALPRVPSLAAENASLRDRLRQCQLELAQARELARHHREADTLLHLPAAREGLVAAVMGRSTMPTQHTVLLNRGARHGLSLDSVIVDEAGVIGRVIEVQPATCLVMLLTDPDSRVAALVERSRETGLLVGQESGRCAFTYVAADADLQEGDRIVTAGLGGPFPKGLLLGTVEHIERDVLSGSATASVIPAARLSRLEEVLCLPPSTH